jgi:hypothetical protein
MAKDWLLLQRLMWFFLNLFVWFLDKIQQRWLSYMPNWWMQIVQKTFVKEGAQSMAPNQVAGEILSFFTRNNFTVSDRGEVIT